MNEDGVDVRVCAFESSNTMLTRSVMVTLTTQDDTAQGNHLCVYLPTIMYNW